MERKKFQIYEEISNLLIYPHTTGEFYKFTVDVIYAFIIGESFKEVSPLLTLSNALFPHWFELLKMGMIYLVIVTGWIGYHKSIASLTESGRWGTVRYVIDLTILFIVFNSLLYSRPSNYQDYSVVFILLLPLLYTLYLIWDFAKTKQLIEDSKIN